MIADYFRNIEPKLADSEVIADRSIDYKEFSDDEGMVRGKVLFINGCLLQFMEYVCLGKTRPKYRFHLQDKDGEMILRYDNAKHISRLLNLPASDCHCAARKPPIIANSHR